MRTRSAPARSNARRAVKASSIWDSTRPAMRSSDSRRSSSSRVKACRTFCTLVLWAAIVDESRTSGGRLSKSPCDVILGSFVFRPPEEVDGGSELHQLAVAVIGVHQHEGRVVGYSRGLLHVVGHDHDRVALGQAVHQVVDLE